MKYLEKKLQEFLKNECYYRLASPDGKWLPRWQELDKKAIDF